jgi:hypothetical protein
MSSATKAGKAHTDELQTGTIRMTVIRMSRPLLKVANGASSEIPAGLKRLFIQPGRAPCLRKLD